MTAASAIETPNLAVGEPHIHKIPSPFDNTSPAPELITQGAEALVYKTTFLDSTPAALKFRPSKPYRHPTLDQRLTKARVLAEARVLVKLSGLNKDGINVPAVLSLEWDVARKAKHVTDDQKGQRGGAWILMEWIEGKSVKQILRENPTEEYVKRLLRNIGKAVAAMHFKGGVVHGDLTTSNIMVRSDEIVLIDFGLATQSVQDEDRAVDLYVLERAFGSTHPKQEDWFDSEVLQNQEGYRGTKGANVVLKRLEEVRLRGRKRSMLG